MGSATGEVTPYATPGGVADQGAMGSDGIRTEIESTRADMSETVDAIQAKLSPRNVQETTEQVTKQVKEAAIEVSEIAAERLKRAAIEVSDQIRGDIHNATIGRVEKVMNNVKGTTRDASSSLLETIKDNPVPAAMIGIGLAWLVMSKTNSNRPAERGQYYSDYPRSSSSSYTQYPQFEPDQSRVGARAQQFAGNVQDKAGRVADSVSGAAETVKDKASDVVDQAQQRFGEFGEQVQGQAQQVVRQSKGILEENPLIVGAVALALGAAIGLAIPETRRENELMGETRDRFMRQAGDAAHETIQKVQHVATEAMHATQDAVKQEARNQGLVSDQPAGMGV